MRVRHSRLAGTPGLGFRRHKSNKDFLRVGFRVLAAARRDLRNSLFVSLFLSLFQAFVFFVIFTITTTCQLGIRVSRVGSQELWFQGVGLRVCRCFLGVHNPPPTYSLEFSKTLHHTLHDIYTSVQFVYNHAGYRFQQTVPLPERAKLLLLLLSCSQVE